MHGEVFVCVNELTKKTRHTRRHAIVTHSICFVWVFLVALFRFFSSAVLSAHIEIWILLPSRACLCLLGGVFCRLPVSLRQPDAVPLRKDCISKTTKKTKKMSYCDLSWKTSFEFDFHISNIWMSVRVQHLRTLRTLSLAHRLNWISSFFFGPWLLREDIALFYLFPHYIGQHRSFQFSHLILLLLTYFFPHTACCWRPLHHSKSLVSNSPPPSRPNNRAHPQMAEGVKLATLQLRALRPETPSVSIGNSSPRGENQRSPRTLSAFPDVWSIATQQRMQVADGRRGRNSLPRQRQQVSSFKKKGGRAISQ